MIRIASLALVLSACVSCNKSSSATPPPTGATGTPVTAVPAAGGSAAFVDDPKFHLKPDEGTLEIGKAEGKAGSEAVATIKVTPAAGFHINTEFPTQLKLESPPGVKLAKTDLVAGKGDKGDADPFTEQALAFAVKATADKPGAYEVKGVFRFGVCDQATCHPKKQPITIQVAAN